MQQDHGNKAPPAPAPTPADAETETLGARQEILAAALRTAADMLDIQHALLTRIRNELNERSGSVSIETAAMLTTYVDDLDTEVV